MAAKYDLMNDLMSAGVHRCWKDRFTTLLCPSASIKHLDVAGGTGRYTLPILFTYVVAVNDVD